MFQALNFLVGLLLLIVPLLVLSREIVQLEGFNFELTSTMHRYLAVLFYDTSPEGEKLRELWKATADLIQDDQFTNDSEIGMIDGDDRQLQEMLSVYQIEVPDIRLFRNGIAQKYKGSMDPRSLADFLIDDSKSAITRIVDYEDFQKSQEVSLNETVVYGFFSEEQIKDEDGYDYDEWSQFSATAGVFRSQARFYVSSASFLMKVFKIKQSDLPLILMSNNEEGFLRYNGEIVEFQLSQWILRYSLPGFDELTLATTKGEMYSTQFFSARKVKFILFLTPNLVDSSLSTWREVADANAGKAIFSYATQGPIADLYEYFEINREKDVPLMVAYNPLTDGRYKSSIKLNTASTKRDMEAFILSVLNGQAVKLFKSEPLPRQTGLAIKAVGRTVIDIVSQPEKDVLLAVLGQSCPLCKQMLPTLDILGKAMKNEARISITKIDASLNDLPQEWNIRGYPTVLWFPAKDKPFKSGIPPVRHYWDAGFSLQEMVAFIQKESSFDRKSLQIATTEQLLTLLGEEEKIRSLYEEEELALRRNEGRKVYEDAWVDWLVGEVVFDGKRLHIAVVAFLILTWLAMASKLIHLNDRPKLVTKIVKVSPTGRNQATPIETHIAEECSHSQDNPDKYLSELNIAASSTQKLKET